MKNTTWDDLLYPGKADDFFSRRPFPPFDPATCAYNPTNALWLAELSRLAYQEDTAQARFLEKVGGIRRQFFQSHQTDTQALLAEFGGATPFAVLAFRGTEQHIKDFVTNLTIGKLPHGDKKIEVHEGFKRALDSVWPEIETALRQLSCPIFFTGHSLGAALATLSAARHTPTALYTFGSPAVGDAAFADSLRHIANIIHRVVNGSDVVATLPPAALGFCHVGTAHTLAASASGNTLFSWLTDWRYPPTLLADHAPVNYVDRI